MDNSFQVVVSIVMVKIINDLGMLGLITGIIAGIVVDKHYPQFGTKINTTVTDSINTLHTTMANLT
jgi:hypothetical protein